MEYLYKQPQVEVFTYFYSWHIPHWFTKDKWPFFSLEKYELEKYGSPKYFPSSVKGDCYSFYIMVELVGYLL